MRLKRVSAVARKETLHVLRDARSLGMAIAMPLVLLLLFGYALTLDVDNVPLVVWDQSRTEASRDFISRFTGSRYFGWRGYVDNYRDLVQAVDRGDVLVALVVPRDFGGNLAAGRPATVQLIADASDANTATIALGYADAIAQTFSQAVTTEMLQRLQGVTPRPPLDFRPRVWFNTDLQSKNYIIPGLVAVIMMVIAALLTSLTVAREWERGTMEQLIATPVQGSELILGKLLPYFAIGLLDMALAMFVGQILFHVPMRGSVALLFGLAAIFLAGALSLGILISIQARSQLLANQLAMILTLIPAFLLSGFMYAISNMPRAIQLITYLVPSRYFIAALKAIYLKGVGLEIIGGEALVLAVFAVVLTLMANLRFKKKLA